MDDEHRNNQSLNQSQTEGALASTGNAHMLHSNPRNAKKKKKQKTKVQMEEEIAALEKERKKTKNPVRRKEACISLGKLYMRLGQGARALPILQAATQAVTRAELIEIELGMEEVTLEHPLTASICVLRACVLPRM